MTKFSIITITYNNFHGLQRTSQSILTQSSKDFEWIIIDGNSSDGTKDYLKTLPATHIVSEPDAGIYDAMNKGLGKATGTYVIFMNAGDAFAAPDTLDKINDSISNAPDFIYGDALEGPPYRYKKSRPHKHIILGMFTHHQAMLYRRDTIGALRFDTRYTIAADYDFTCRFLKQCKDICYFPHPVCLFEMGGVSQKNANKGRDEQFEIRKHLHLCNPLSNHVIRFVQMCRWILKRKWQHHRGPPNSRRTTSAR